MILQITPSSVPISALPPLLRLPAELRNNIYEYALGRPEFQVTCKLDMIIRNASPSLALLRACRQTHIETTSLFWSISTFDCHLGLQYMRLWLETQSLSRQAAISSVKVRFMTDLEWDLDDTLSMWSLDRDGLLQSLQCCDLPGLKRIYVDVHVISCNYHYAVMWDWNGQKLARATDKLFGELKSQVEAVFDEVVATFGMTTTGTRQV
jgi:hypothetical protein